MSGDLAGVKFDPTGVPATIGTAQGAKSSGVATFTINGVSVSCQVPRDLTVAANDVCLIQRVGSQWFAVQRYYSAAAANIENPTVPPPKPTVVTGSLVCAPVETRSYRTVFGGWRDDNDDVYQGQYSGNGNHTGCAFYGNKPRSLAGATVTSATVKLRRRSAGGRASAQDTTFWLVTEKTRPSGAPTLGSSTDGPNLKWGESDTFTIPDSWAQAMVDGTAGGLAIHESDGSPYVILAGRGSYSASFTLTIRWQR